MKSNRGQHIPANIVIATTITAIDAAIFASPTAIITGLSCFVTELWAWPDRDIEHKRKGVCFLDHWYWLAYERLIPYHRHPLSHSLLPGLILRLVWGFWPLTIPAMDAVIHVENLSLLLSWMPIAARAIVGAIASDCTHYALDGYGPYQWLLGKK